MRPNHDRPAAQHGWRARSPLSIAGVAKRGMTLIELMIVVAVVALLGAVALPAYQSSVRKAHRADAKTALTTAAQQLERFYTENNRYDTATVGSDRTDTISPTTENQYYTLALGVISGTRNAYILTATPQGAQASDSCGSFTLNQDGGRGVVPPAGSTLTVADCW